MPNTDLMDRVVALIKAVPELHDPQALSSRLGDTRGAVVRAQLATLPEGVDVGPIRAELATCGSAHCFAGWTMILAGYRYHRRHPAGWYDRDGQGDELQPIGIPRIEAYDLARQRGLFWNGNTVPMIEAWVAYFKTEIDLVELNRRLAKESANA